MLKIKNNVDLKELKQYGFKITYDSETGEYNYCRVINKKHLVNHWFEINVDIKTKELMIMSYSTASFSNSHSDIEIVIEDLLYDLIKADLVEKVEE